MLNSSIRHMHTVYTDQQPHLSGLNEFKTFNCALLFSFKDLKMQESTSL